MTDGGGGGDAIVGTARSGFVKSYSAVINKQTLMMLLIKILAVAQKNRHLVIFVIICIY